MAKKTLCDPSLRKDSYAPDFFAEISMNKAQDQNACRLSRFLAPAEPRDDSAQLALGADQIIASLVLKRGLNRIEINCIDVVGRISLRTPLVGQMDILEIV